MGNGGSLPPFPCVWDTVGEVSGECIPLESADLLTTDHHSMHSSRARKWSATTPCWMPVLDGYLRFSSWATCPVSERSVGFSASVCP
jgi:hypothetical protein